MYWLTYQYFKPWASIRQLWYKSQDKPNSYPNTTMDFIDEQRNADMLDAMADIAYEQEQAMREEWDKPIEDQHEPKDWTT